MSLIGGCKKETDDGADQAADQAEKEARDAGILIEAAGFEEQAIQVYTAAAGLAFVKADKLLITTAGRFMGQHEEHRDSLMRAARKLGLDKPLGDIKPPPIPPNILDDALTVALRRGALLEFARDLEMQAATAYYDHVTQKLASRSAIRVVADILPVEAQHVAVYDLLLDVDPAPTPFFSEQV